jgi:hypothetical protein
MAKLFYFNLSITLLSLHLSFARDKATIVPMHSSNCDISNGTSTFETFNKIETLLLNGKAFLKNKQFSNGTIEGDAYANKDRSFASIIFRKEQNTIEDVYIRLHKSNQPEALRYSPT